MNGDGLHSCDSGVREFGRDWKVAKEDDDELQNGSCMNEEGGVVCLRFVALGESWGWEKIEALGLLGGLLGFVIDGGGDWKSPAAAAHHE